MTLTFRCPAELGGAAAAAGAGCARSSRLAEGDAVAGFQRDQWPGSGHRQTLSALCRCHDLRLSDPADVRHPGRKRRDSPGTTICRRAEGFVSGARRSVSTTASQVAGTPLFEPDRFVIKFHNLWTIEAPEGYAVLFTHPAQPLRSAVHHVDRPRRLRPLSRQLGSFPGALARLRISAAYCRRERRSRNACR